MCIWPSSPTGQRVAPAALKSGLSARKDVPPPCRVTHPSCHDNVVARRHPDARFQGPFEWGFHADKLGPRCRLSGFGWALWSRWNMGYLCHLRSMLRPYKSYVASLSLRFPLAILGAHVRAMAKF
eukprot:scaffold26728_cov33-Tisochrysis_lutea.AAC.1